LNPIKKTFRYGSHDVTFETGEIARQAHGSVVCTMDDTVVLATVVAAREPKAGQDWFPLTVDYVEKTYAAGKIPGGFFKREGRPSEKETLTSRLIDRPIRPLFPDGFFNEVQVVATVLSLNPEVDSDIPAMLAVSAALTLSVVRGAAWQDEAERWIHEALLGVDRAFRITIAPVDSLEAPADGRRRRVLSRAPLAWNGL